MTAMPWRAYFGDFGRVADLGKALEAGFVYDGRYSRYRRRRHGNSAAGRPGKQFVVCTQNHDQIANGTIGRRLAMEVGREARAIAMPRQGEPWRLALWSGESRFGGTAAAPPPPRDLEAEDTVTLGAWQAALYLRSEAR